MTARSHLNIAEMTLNQVNECLMISRSKDVSKAGASAVLRSSLILTISTLEAYNTNIAAYLMYFTLSKEPLVVDDPRLDEWKPIYNKRYLRDATPPSELGHEPRHDLILESLGRTTLNRFPKIKEYLALFGIDAWDAVARSGLIQGYNDETNLERSLGLYVDRRNGIAHGGDFHSGLWGLNPIRPEFVEDCLSLVHELIRQIDAAVDQWCDQW